MSQDEKWYVGIYQILGGGLVKKLGPYRSEREAEKAREGVERNLNLDLYRTEVSK